MSKTIEPVRAADKSARYEHAITLLETEIEEAGSLEEALSIALDRVVKASHAAAGTFWFYDQFGDGTLHPKAIRGGVDLGRLSLRFGEGIAGQVVARSKSTIVLDCQSDPDWAGYIDQWTGFTTRSMICVPLRYQQYTFGCIEIINKMDDQRFDEIDLKFLEKLADHTAYLFAAQHMLDHYVAINDPATPRQLGEEPTFTELFTRKSFADVEKTLMKLPEVNALPAADGKNVLNKSHEIWSILDDNETPKHGKEEFHLFQAD